MFSGKASAEPALRPLEEQLYIWKMTFPKLDTSLVGRVSERLMKPPMDWDGLLLFPSPVALSRLTHGASHCAERSTLICAFTSIVNALQGSEGEMAQEHAMFPGWIHDAQELAWRYRQLAQRIPGDVFVVSFQQGLRHFGRDPCRRMHFRRGEHAADPYIFGCFLLTHAAMLRARSSPSGSGHSPLKCGIPSFCMPQYRRALGIDLYFRE